MSPEIPPPETLAPEAPQPESYPFWGYFDLFAFVLLGMLGLLVESLVAGMLLKITHAKQAVVLFPAQVLLYGFLLGSLAWMFRRYYGRPFWQSLRWSPAALNAPFATMCGVGAAFGVIFGSVLLRTPDMNSPMKDLLSDPTSMVLLAVLGVTLAPLCEEIVFRGFLQPLLVRSLGAAGGVLLAGTLFGLMHLPEYGYSWRHAVLLSGAGSAFGWMRYRSGSTKAAVVMHAAYNGVFFVLLATEQLAVHGRWVGR